MGLLKLKGSFFNISVLTYHKGSFHPLMSVISYNHIKWSRVDFFSFYFLLNPVCRSHDNISTINHTQRANARRDWTEDPADIAK